MTWTYSGNPSDSDKDAVRFLVGDKDSTDQQISDEEITFLMTQKSNVYAAAALAAGCIAAKYARDVGSSIESVRVFSADRYKHYKDLENELDNKSKGATSDGYGLPVVTGISESDIRSVEQDTDRVQSAFKKRQFDNPPYGRRDDYPDYYGNG